MSFILAKVNMLLAKANLTLKRKIKETEDPEFLRIYSECKSFTMTGEERMFALYKAVDYIVSENIPGDFVECGVWKGGSIMLIIKELLKRNIIDRDIYLYDTFEGMTMPTEKDKSLFGGKNPVIEWAKQVRGANSEWCYASIEEVRNNVLSLGYPQERIHFVKGKVEETLLSTLPERVALLRLDTDWYESTYKEMVYLFPLLVTKGVLIVDDYGYWEGAKKACDQYFNEKGVKMLMTYIDGVGTISIKT